MIGAIEALTIETVSGSTYEIRENPEFPTEYPYLVRRVNSTDVRRWDAEWRPARVSVPAEGACLTITYPPNEDYPGGQARITSTIVNITHNR